MIQVTNMRILANHEAFEQKWLTLRGLNHKLQDTKGVLLWTKQGKWMKVGSTTQRVGIEHDGNIFKTVLHLSGHVADWKIRRKRKQEAKSEEAPAEGPVTGWLPFGELT